MAHNLPVLRLFRRNLVAPLLQTWRDAGNLWRYGTFESETFDASRLAAFDPGLTEHAFADAEFAAAWLVAEADIEQAMGVRQVRGGINPGDRRALYQLTRALRPRTFLEVGTHSAASSLCVARALLDNGYGRITTVDLADVNDPEAGAWLAAGMRAPPQQLASSLGLSQLLDFVTSPALDFLRTTPGRFDLVFLDGARSPGAVYRELAATLDVLAEDGRVLLHDYYPRGRPLFKDGQLVPGPYQALQRVMRENDAIEVVPLGELPWTTRGASHATTLAFVAAKRR